MSDLLAETWAEIRGSHVIGFVAEIQPEAAELLLAEHDEFERVGVYADCLARGLSDAEARGTAWPENESVNVT